MWPRCRDRRTARNPQPALPLVLVLHAKMRTQDALQFLDVFLGIRLQPRIFPFRVLLSKSSNHLDHRPHIGPEPDDAEDDATGLSFWMFNKVVADIPDTDSFE